jgi:threonine synthase
MAWRSGLSIDHLVAATNINKVVPEYLSSGVYTPAVSLQTIASAMDVGNPGNFHRLTRLFDDEFRRIASAISGYWFDDTRIREHIRQEFRRTGYILDPHGAVASLGLDSYLEEHPEKSGIFVETAHPGKFTGTVEPLIETDVEIPESLRGFMEGQKESVIMKSGSDQLADFLASRYLTG